MIKCRSCNQKKDNSHYKLVWKNGANVTSPYCNNCLNAPVTSIGVPDIDKMFSKEIMTYAKEHKVFMTDRMVSDMITNLKDNGLDEMLVAYRDSRYEAKYRPVLTLYHDNVGDNGALKLGDLKANVNLAYKANELLNDPSKAICVKCKTATDKTDMIAKDNTCKSCAFVDVFKTHVPLGTFIPTVYSTMGNIASRLGTTLNFSLEEYKSYINGEAVDETWALQEHLNIMFKSGIVNNPLDLMDKWINVYRCDMSKSISCKLRIHSATPATGLNWYNFDVYLKGVTDVSNHKPVLVSRDYGYEVAKDLSDVIENPEDVKRIHKELEHGSSIATTDSDVLEISYL